MTLILRITFSIFVTTLVYSFISNMNGLIFLRILVYQYWLFMYIYEETVKATNFKPHYKWVISVQFKTKIGTHENKTIDSSM